MAKTIMTIDDSVNVRKMIEYTLVSAGYEVVQAVDGRDGLEKLELHEIDMVITDLNMPNLDGIGLIKGVRQIARYRFIPIIMLTTESQKHMKLEAKAAGATGWIVKPFNPEQLLVVVKKVLR